MFSAFSIESPAKMPRQALIVLSEARLPGASDLSSYLNNSKYSRDKQAFFMGWLAVDQQQSDDRRRPGISSMG
jgi:hypothetical protein